MRASSAMQVALIAALSLQPAYAQQVRRTLEPEELRALAHCEACDPSAFEVALRRALGGEKDRDRARCLAHAALRLSPLEMPRGFTGRREENGWDAALCIALEDLAERDECGRRARTAHGLLHPDTSDVAGALGAWRGLIADVAGEPLLAHVLFALADRLAPIATHREAASELLESALLDAADPFARHVLALAVVRLDAAAFPHELRFTSRAAWSAALAAAKPELVARCELARELDFLRRGDEGVRSEALRNLADWTERHADAPSELRAIALEARLATLIARGRSEELAQAISALPDFDGDAAEHAAAIVLAARRELEGASGGSSPDLGLLPRLERIAGDEATSEVALAAHGLLARLAARSGQAASELRHWTAAADERWLPVPLLATELDAARGLSAWEWIPRRPSDRLDAREEANTAAWVLGERACASGDWAAGARWLELARATPAHCGKDAPSRELERAHLCATCCEKLGKIDAARSLLLSQVRADHISTDLRAEALYRWLDFELGRGEIERVVPAIRAAQLEPKIRGEAELYVAWWRASTADPTRARVLRAELERCCGANAPLARRLQ